MNRLTMPELPAVADLLVDIGARSWMVILTAAMGRATVRPLLLHPFHLLYLFPLLADIKREKLDPNGIAFFPGNNVGYFGPACRDTSLRQRPWPHVERLRRGRFGARHRSGRPDQGLPVAANVRLCTRKHSRASAARTCIAAQAGEDGSSHRSCGASARLALTPRVARAAAPGHRTYCSGGRATIRSATPARLPGRGRPMEKLEPVTAAPGEPFDFGCYRIVEVPFGPDIETDLSSG